MDAALAATDHFDCRTRGTSALLREISFFLSFGFSEVVVVVPFKVFKVGSRSIYARKGNLIL